MLLRHMVKVPPPKDAHGSTKEESMEEEMDLKLKYNVKEKGQGYDIGSISSMLVAMVASLLSTWVLQSFQNGECSK